MITLRHPSRRRLQAWSEEPDPRVDSHVETCDRCANRLEEMATPVPSLASALDQVLDVPEDIAPRVADGIARKMQARAELGLAAEMLRLPVWVVQLLEEGDENGS